MADILIVNPSNPGQSQYVTAANFNPAIHTRWEERDKDRGTVAAPPANVTARPSGTTSSEVVVRTINAGTSVDALVVDPDGDAKFVKGFGVFNTGPVTARQTYTVTNGLTDRAYDADTVAVAELADIVSTLIADLRAYGFVL